MPPTPQRMRCLVCLLSLPPPSLLHRWRHRAMPSIGIAGAGLVGRLLAFALLHKGWRITLFDSYQRAGGQSAAVVAAGMLAPYAELETVEPLVFNLGKRSLELWPQWLAALEQPVFFQQTGTLLIAHRQDRADMERFVSHIRTKLGEHAELQAVDATQLAALEPELA